MRIEYHRTLLGDHVRNAAFEKALRALIRPGETVVADIGAGTGFLGLLASRLGAREVFLYESAAVAGVAEEVLKTNKARNCHVVPFASFEMDEPPQVDLVVSETLGNYPLEEDIVATLNDALKRHLKPGGQIIPGGLTQYVAPVVDPRFHGELAVWGNVGEGLDFSVAQSMSFNNVYVRAIDTHAVLNGGQACVMWDRLDFTKQNRANRKGTARWMMVRDETVFGFATWWEAELAPGVVLSTAPDAPKTHWEQLYFPISEPIRASVGETVQIALRSRSSSEAGTHLAWTATLEDGGGKIKVRHAHDLDRGYLE